MDPDKSGNHIFLSYSSDDRDTAARLAAAIQNQGFEVFPSR